jgi:SagB-type dehydrogenase family enzyme
MCWLDRRGFLELIIILGAVGVRWIKPFKAISAASAEKEGPMILTKPNNKGSLSVEEAIKKRRTVRSFGSRPLRKEDLSQLLYGAQGITEDRGSKRAVASGGALFPLDVYAVMGDKGAEGLDAGVYHYIPSGHRIESVAAGDKRKQLAKASLNQMWMADSPLNLVITAEYSRICSKYGDRGIRYAMIEAGHAGQNIFLQAEALGLKAGIVGAFNDMEVIKVLGISQKHEPLLIMPVGYQA